MNRHAFAPVFFLLLFTSILTYGQKTVADSINRLLAKDLPDTSRILLKIRLSSAYNFYMLDSAISVIKEASNEAQRLRFKRGEARALNILGSVLRNTGELPQALESYFQALEICRAIHDREEETRSLVFIGYCYSQLGEGRQGISYLRQAEKIKERSILTDILLLTSMGTIYERMNQLDSGLIFQQRAYALLKNVPRGTLGSLILTNLGIVNARLKNDSLALQYYQDAIENAVITGDLLNLGRVQYRIADLYHQLNNADSAMFYARLSFFNSLHVSQNSELNASSLLANLFEASGNLDSAFYYQKIAVASKDSMFGPEKFQRLQMFTLNEQQRQQEIIQEQERYKNKIRLIALLVIALFLLIIAIILLRNNRNKQKVNGVLLNQKNEIQKALTMLKATQNQLIQSEKMASLGELTSGIAHEIQNPLNFVNNFSEVNGELISELKGELASDSYRNGNLQNVIDIIDDIDQNLAKINHHGKRADAIVKGMLEHSRQGTGQKQLTDINALADEYLKLAYHGMRAKDKDPIAIGFNVTTKTDFDNSIGKINIVAQDIGRVLLNIYNNAFYAVKEKQAISRKLQAVSYEPVVTVTTRKDGEKIIITVADNGIGIPQNVIDKIFQPFFTTKPAGQGTGLGLSLAYDIVKAHGGEIKADNTRGTAFIIRLPL